MTDFNGANVEAISEDNNGIKLQKDGKEPTWFDITDNALQYVSKGNVLKSATQQDGTITYVETKSNPDKGNSKGEGESGLASKQTGTEHSRYHPATAGMAIKEANRFLLEATDPSELSAEEWTTMLSENAEALLNRLEGKGLVTRQ